MIGFHIDTCVIGSHIDTGVIGFHIDTCVIGSHIDTCVVGSHIDTDVIGSHIDTGAIGSHIDTGVIGPHIKEEMWSLMILDDGILSKCVMTLFQEVIVLGKKLPVYFNDLHLISLKALLLF